MAALTAANAKHATLATTVADSVTLTGTGRRVYVTNRAAAGGANLHVTWGTTATAANVTTPVANADDTLVVVPQATKVIDLGGSAGTVTVKVVGSANAYSVERY